MDRKRLLELINSPDTISQSEIAELFTLSQEYPYFQAVFALVAKTTQRTEDIQKAAIQTLHRSFLQKWMDNSQFNPNHQLPDLKGLDIRANQVNAFETLATITDQTHPHHLSVNISEGDQNKTVEIEVNFAKENTDKEQTALFEQEEKNEDLETYFHLAENPEKIDELVAQKAEEQLSKTNLPEDEIPNGDENSLRDYLQKAMEEIKQIKSSAIQKSEELASQSQATTDTSSESISSEVLSDAHTVSDSTENFVEPNYNIAYSYEEVDKFPYLEENNNTDMPLFKENEIQELQKMVQSIQEGAQGKKEEKEPDPQEELSTYETTTLSLNPDFF
ncbi:MAG: hypothetical protein RMJ89_02635 [Flammeovirgaceae bacterium]|nr:hypothetical protein [Flammeovirgaceae bacterium]